MPPKPRTRDSQLAKKEDQTPTMYVSEREQDIAKSIATQKDCSQHPIRPSTENMEQTDERKEMDKSKTLAKPDEIIGYVETVYPPKRNRTGTMEYHVVTFQVHGGKRKRAVCFSKTKRQLLLERKTNKTVVKVAKFNYAKDSETFFNNDMTSFQSSTRRVLFPIPRDKSILFTLELKRNSGTFRNDECSKYQSEPWR